MDEIAEQRIRAEIKRRGLVVKSFGAGVFLIVGKGVEVLVTDLAELTTVDLTPVHESKRYQQRKS
jgi:hypothetical protein